MLGGLRPAGHIKHDAAGDPDMEDCSRSTEGYNATLKPPVAGTMRAADTDHQDLLDRSPELGLFGARQDTHFNHGRHLAGSTMEQQDQAVRLGTFTSNTDAADVKTADSAKRSGKREGPDSQLPQP